MTIGEIVALTGAKVRIAGEPARQASGGVASDVMSHVIVRGFRGMVWITSLANMNVLAVAVMKEAACVLLAGGAQMSEPVLERAQAEHVVVLESDKSAFELAGLMYEGGLRGEETRLSDAKL